MPERPAQLTGADKRVLRRLLRRGAVVAGCPMRRWTQRRVHQVIEPEFGVLYHVNSICRLVSKLGWSVRQPVRGAGTAGSAC